MEVILLEDVNKLGNAGELVKVKPGFARNFLLPKSLAVFADAASLKNFERRREKLEEEAQRKREEAEAKKQALQDVESITLTAKAGATGKLFGSITKELIAAALKDQLNIEVDRHKIKVSSPINSIGDHVIVVGLGSGIEADILVKVIAEE